MRNFVRVHACLLKYLLRFLLNLSTKLIELILFDFEEKNSCLEREREREREREISSIFFSIQKKGSTELLFIP